MKKGGLSGLVVMCAFLLGCGAPQSDADSLEEVAEVASPLDTNCHIDVWFSEAFVSETEPGRLQVNAWGSCTDSPSTEYRVTVINPRSKTLILSDWSSNGLGSITLPAGSPQGTYQAVGEMRRAGSTVDVAKGSQKLIVGEACNAASLSTLPTGSAPLDSVVLVTPDLSCPSTSHEWRLTVKKPGGGTMAYPWQQAPTLSWSTAGLSAGTATLQLAVRNVGNTVPDVAAQTTIVLGPVCSVGELTVTGNGNARSVTSTATCVGGGVPVFRYSVTAPDGSVTQLRDFQTNALFDWNVTDLDGAFTLKVEVRAQQTSEAPVTTKTTKLTLGNACTKLTLPDIWGSHDIHQPFVVTATANCNQAEYQFQRRVPSTTTWTTVCPYSSAASCDFSTADVPAGDYVVRALVRKARSIAAYDKVSAQREYVALDGRRPLIRTIVQGSTFFPRRLSADGHWVINEQTRWSRTTGNVALPIPLWASFSSPDGAQDVNDTGGVIVGFAERGNAREPFRIQGNTADWLFPSPLPLGTQARAVATNGNGTVIIGDIAELGSQRVFRWTKDGVERVEELPTGFSSSEARDVNGDGTVVVGDLSTPSNHYEGFRWTKSGGTRQLGMPPGAADCTAKRVAKDGDLVIGWCSGPDGLHAVRWSVAGNAQRLPEPDVELSNPEAMSSDGSVIVGGVAKGHEQHAVMWTAEGVRYLADVLTEQGTDLTDWHLSWSVDVSRDGKTIIGTGRAPGVVETGWLITFP